MDAMREDEKKGGKFSGFGAIEGVLGGGSI